MGHWPLISFEVLDSTSTYALENLKELSLHYPNGFAIQSDRQLKGRGQRGRDWTSLAGNVFLTLALPREKTNWRSVDFGYLVQVFVRARYVSR